MESLSIIQVTNCISLKQTGPNTYECLKCANTHILESGLCTSLCGSWNGLSNCLKCDLSPSPTPSYICTICNVGYFLTTENTCQKLSVLTINDLKNCKQFDQVSEYTYSCTECLQRFELSYGDCIDRCTDTISNCEDCSVSDDVTCK